VAARHASKKSVVPRVALVVVIVVVAAVGGFVAVQLTRAVPRQTVSTVQLASVTVPGKAVLPWPSPGQAAVTIAGITPVLTSGPETAAPMASLAKMMTALLILRDHPLTGQEPGPTLTVTAADVAILNAQQAVQGSVLPVTAGETLSERQALEALMIPSADNIAELLAAWDAGSLSAFLTKMNAEAASMGMAHTTYTDPSGLDQKTVSTPLDQLMVARAAMANPVLAGIVGMPSATFAVGGTLANINHYVGHFGDIGVKTGSDSYAGGCWAFAAVQKVAGTPRLVLGVVMGVRGTSQGLVIPALQAGLTLASALASSIHPVTVAPAGTIVGYVHAPWRGAVALRTTSALQGLARAGQTITPQIRLRVPGGRSVRLGAALGQVRVRAGDFVGAGSTPVVAAGSGAGPSLWWRLTHF
jgi:D-alanyl-D-alanine carboxypeptidase (penicillin-binding protein 5/6)